LLRKGFAAVLGQQAVRQNSLHALRAFRSNSCRKSVHDARCARDRPPCASRHCTGAAPQAAPPL